MVEYEYLRESIHNGCFFSLLYRNYTLNVDLNKMDIWLGG
ncbi:hypothetical protein [Bacillus phage PfIS075]|nr:hypothetical protein [Bacillus phage PfNC7401]ANT40297.1 hypothetical protein [Bacillus phage PfIS075]